MCFLFQCTICLRVPQACLERLFAMGLKTPHSCRSALWTAVLASSPLSTLKAKGSPASTTPGIQNLFVACHLLCSYSHRLHKKDVNQISRTCEVTDVSLGGRTGWSELGLAETFAVAPFSLWVCWWPAGLPFQREFRLSLYRIPVTPDCQPSKDTNEVMRM